MTIIMTYMIMIIIIIIIIIIVIIIKINLTSLFNVKSDDWRSRAYLKKAIVNIKTYVTSNKLMTFRGKIPLH